MWGAPSTAFYKEEEDSTFEKKKKKHGFYTKHGNVPG